MDRQPYWVAELRCKLSASLRTFYVWVEISTDILAFSCLGYLSYSRSLRLDRSRITLDTCFSDSLQYSCVRLVGLASGESCSGSLSEPPSSTVEFLDTVRISLSRQFRLSYWLRELMSK